MIENIKDLIDGGCYWFFSAQLRRDGRFSRKEKPLKVYIQKHVDNWGGLYVDIYRYFSGTEADTSNWFDRIYEYEYGAGKNKRALYEDKRECELDWNNKLTELQGLFNLRVAKINDEIDSLKL